MKCRQVQEILLEPAENKMQSVELHLKHCSACRQFQVDLSGIQALTLDEAPEVDSQFLSRVHRLTIDEIQSVPLRNSILGVPAHVLGILSSSISLAGFWGLWVLLECLSQGRLTTAGLFALLLLFQSILSLVFMPLLLKGKLGKRQKSFGQSFPIDANEDQELYKMLLA